MVLFQVEKIFDAIGIYTCLYVQIYRTAVQPAHADEATEAYSLLVVRLGFAGHCLSCPSC